MRGLSPTRCEMDLQKDKQVFPQCCVAGTVLDLFRKVNAPVDVQGIPVFVPVKSCNLASVGDFSHNIYFGSTLDCATEREHVPQTRSMSRYTVDDGLRLETTPTVNSSQSQARRDTLMSCCECSSKSANPSSVNTHLPSSDDSNELDDQKPAIFCLPSLCQHFSCATGMSEHQSLTDSEITVKDQLSQVFQRYCTVSSELEQANAENEQLQKHIAGELAVKNDLLNYTEQLENKIMELDNQVKALKKTKCDVYGGGDTLLSEVPSQDSGIQLSASPSLVPLAGTDAQKDLLSENIQTYTQSTRTLQDACSEKQLQLNLCSYL